MTVAELDTKEEERILRTVDIALGTNDKPGQKIVGKRKVAIVGFAPSSFRLAPYNFTVFDDPDNGFELWGLNELYKVPGVVDEKFSRWFDIHDRRDGDFSLRDPQNIQWLATRKFPIYLQDHYPDVPTSVRYPVEEVIKRYRTTYWTNTISYELALAGMEGRYNEDVYAEDGTLLHRQGEIEDPTKAVGEVHVYGVDMAQADHTPGSDGGEYARQRPSCEYMIGFLRGMGIKVFLPEQSDLLFTPFLYGYQGDGQKFRAKLRSRHDELSGRSNSFRMERERLLLNAASTEGAAKAFDNVATELLKAAKISPADAEEFKTHAAGLMTQSQQFQAQAQQATLNQAGLDGAKDGLSYVERAWTGTIEQRGPAVPS